MAVYEQSYKPYTGRMTPDWSRFLIIPRHAYRAVFSSKLFIAFFALCFLPFLIEAIFMYLRYNYGALAASNINVRELIPVDASFFEWFCDIQMCLAFLMALLIGPPLVSRDLRNNALPLYLCRPFSRTEYVMGKMSVLLILLSLITWIPHLLLFLFQSYLEGFGWFKANLSIAFAIVISSVVWVLLLALLSQSISALVKWRVVASGAMVGLLLIPSVFGAFINEIFSTRIGNLVSLAALIRNVTSGLFGTFDRLSEVRRMSDFDGTVLREIVLNQPPLWASWTMLFLICVACLALLSWKVKAYEVVR